MFQMLMNHGEVEACYLLVNLINKGLIRPPIPEKFTSCHCLDSFGFFPPIKYMFFKCNECNVKICKRCTKYYHRGHDVVEVGNDSCFKCKCSEKGFNKCASIELNVDGNLYITWINVWNVVWKSTFNTSAKIAQKSAIKNTIIFQEYIVSYLISEQLRMEKILSRKLLSFWSLIQFIITKISIHHEINNFQTVIYQTKIVIYSDGWKVWSYC